MDQDNAGDDGSVAKPIRPAEFHDHLTGLVDELERRAATEIAQEGSRQP